MATKVTKAVNLSLDKNLDWYCKLGDGGGCQNL